MRITRAVKGLLIVAFVVFLIQQTADLFFGTHLLRALSLVPHAFWHERAYWQILTYSFVNTDVIHLFFNLMMLAFIGSELEAIWGQRRFLRYYFFCATVSAIFYLLLQLTGLKGLSAQAPLIGASGAIYGLLVAYGILFGDRVLLFMMLFPMKAKHFVWVLGLLQLLTTFYSSGGATSSFALLVGMIAGLAYLLIETRLSQSKRGSQQFSLGSFFRRKKAGKNSRKNRRSNHLKLIVNNDLDEHHLDRGGNEKGKPPTWH